MRQLLLGRYFSGALITSGVFVVDLLIKREVASSFFKGQWIEIIPGLFAITYILNPGVAFGLLSTWNSWLRLPLLLAGTVVALGYILYLYFGSLATRKLPGVALPLIAGGALANLYDRLTVGGVVDYLDFYIYGYHWPAFNLADACITIGVALLFLDSLLARPRATRGL